MSSKKSHDSSKKRSHEHREKHKSSASSTPQSSPHSENRLESHSTPPNTTTSSTSPNNSPHDSSKRNRHNDMHIDSATFTPGGSSIDAQYSTSPHNTPQSSRPQTSYMQDPPHPHPQTFGPPPPPTGSYNVPPPPPPPNNNPDQDADEIDLDIDIYALGATTFTLILTAVLMYTWDEIRDKYARWKSWHPAKSYKNTKGDRAYITFFDKPDFDEAVVWTTQSGFSPFVRIDSYNHDDPSIFADKFYRIVFRTLDISRFSEDEVVIAFKEKLNITPTSVSRKADHNTVTAYLGEAGDLWKFLNVNTLYIKEDITIAALPQYTVTNDANFTKLVTHNLPADARETRALVPHGIHAVTWMTEEKTNRRIAPITWASTSVVDKILRVGMKIRLKTIPYHLKFENFNSWNENRLQVAKLAREKRAQNRTNQANPPPPYRTQYPPQGYPYPPQGFPYPQQGPMHPPQAPHQFYY